jgi:hypothetical protein
MTYYFKNNYGCSILTYVVDDLELLNYTSIVNIEWLGIKGLLQVQASRWSRPIVQLVHFALHFGHLSAWCHYGHFSPGFG